MSTHQIMCWSSRALRQQHNDTKQSSNSASEWHKKIKWRFWCDLIKIETSDSDSFRLRCFGLTCRLNTPKTLLDFGATNAEQAVKPEMEILMNETLAWCVRLLLLNESTHPNKQFHEIISSTSPWLFILSPGFSKRRGSFTFHIDLFNIDQRDVGKVNPCRTRIPVHTDFQFILLGFCFQSTEHQGFKTDLFTQMNKS